MAWQALPSPLQGQVPLGCFNFRLTAARAPPTVDLQHLQPKAVSLSLSCFLGYLATSRRPTAPRHRAVPRRMFGSLVDLSSLVESPAEQVRKRLDGRLQEVNGLEDRFASCSDQELVEEAKKLRGRAKDGEDLDSLLPEAFALVREASKRTLQLRHFDVQILGGIALHQGDIAEMATGEGKTLVAILPAFLNALTGDGVHVVTTNDYLARRDAAWVGRVLRFLGLTVGVIQSDMTSAEKREAYRWGVLQNALGGAFVENGSSHAKRRDISVQT